MLTVAVPAVQTLTRLPLIGLQIFVPASALGCIMRAPTPPSMHPLAGPPARPPAQSLMLTNPRLRAVLPTYLSKNNLAEGKATSNNFLRMTMGNLPRGSSLFWVPFFYVYMLTFYVCWLLYHQYKVRPLERLANFA